MVFANLSSDERLGLGIAVVLHLALVGVLLIRPPRPPVFEPPERMTVNLTSEVGLDATAPEPVRESRAAIAPELAPEPAPRFEPAALPEPRPVATPPPRPRATQAPQPRPSPTSTAPRRRPDTPSTRTQSTPAPRSGGSRIGADFLPGSGDSTTTAESRVPASQIGASAKASLFQAVARQLKPHWQPPSGPDVEDIVTKVRFRLSPDGSLAGRPDVRGQSGVNAVNRAQASRHAEQAVRAIQLAAPFDLPDEYYEAWKVVTVDFDWKLSQ